MHSILMKHNMPEIKLEIIKKISVLSLSVNKRAKSAEPQADMSALEGEIDHAQWVAPRQLYGLSEDKVRIVEGKG